MTMCFGVMSTPIIFWFSDIVSVVARLKRLFHVVALAIVLGALMAAGASAETQKTLKRVALVVGNGTYAHANALPNPPKDATDIAAKLKELGFEVVLGVNLDMGGFGKTLRQFSKEVESADVSLFYYAGHGFQVDGLNYLVPIDAKLETVSDLDFESVRLDSVIGLMEKSSKLSITFLDACRNNPFIKPLTRGAPAVGLAPQRIASGSYIAYATAPGDVAYDGAKAKNSPFTQALLENIDRENVDIRLMMADVRAKVYEATQEKQLPWENNSLIGRFYFRNNPAKTDDATLSAAVEAERTAFDAARALGTTEALQEYLKAYPNGLFSGIAKETVDALGRSASNIATTLDDIFWLTVRDSVLADDFRLYLETFKDGTHRDLAEARIAALEKAAEIQGFKFEDGETLDSKQSLRQTALDRVHELPIAFTQYGLDALGFPIENPTGILDSATRKAIRGYQASIDATQTGELTPRETLDVILAAAATGSQHAETAIGVMTASGIGFQQNDEVARMWLSRAADSGNKYAQANLAVLYRDGRGGAKDLQRARSLAQSAIDQGLPEAEPLLRSLGG
jgi:uncharacterized caspase-like protein